jgi:hypothetical protein
MLDARSAGDNQIVFAVNGKKLRMRARAEKSLESATESGTLDAGRAAPRKST